jgi:hypothetical protein
MTHDYVYGDLGGAGNIMYDNEKEKFVIIDPGPSAGISMPDYT